jgi:hypothetical protein
MIVSPLPNGIELAPLCCGQARTGAIRNLVASGYCGKVHAGARSALKRVAGGDTMGNPAEPVLSKACPECSQKVEGNPERTTCERIVVALGGNALLRNSCAILTSNNAGVYPFLKVRTDSLRRVLFSTLASSSFWHTGCSFRNMQGKCESRKTFFI